MEKKSKKMIVKLIGCEKGLGKIPIVWALIWYMLRIYFLFFNTKIEDDMFYPLFSYSEYFVY